MIRLFISILLLAGVARAQTTLNDWEKLVVKTRSYPCDLGTPVFEGSGLLVKTAQGVEVLTSEHVLIQNSDQKICYEIENSTLGVKSAYLKRVSYLNGLGSLAIDAGLQVGLSADRLAGAALSASQIKSVVALGVPRGSNQLQVLQNGKVATLQSTRALIPGATSVGEFSELAVEYGMSGGLLLAETTSGSFEYLGVLSHQALKRQQGQTTSQIDISEQGNLQKTDLAIGILKSDVTKWMALKADQVINADVIWKRNLTVEGSSVQAGPFRMKMKVVNSKMLSAGGADGAGIGGDDGVATEGQQQVISISLDSRSSKEADSVIAKYPFFKKWRAELLSGKQLSIIQVSKRLSSGRYDTKAISSLDQALTLWIREGYEPIIFPGDVDSMDSALQEKMTAAKQAALSSMQLQSMLMKNAMNRNTVEWLKQMTQQIYLVANQSAQTSSLNVYLSREDVWGELFMNSDQFDLAVELQSYLTSLSGL